MRGPLVTFQGLAYVCGTPKLGQESSGRLFAKVRCKTQGLGGSPVYFDLVGYGQRASLMVKSTCERGNAIVFGGTLLGTRTAKGQAVHICATEVSVVYKPRVPLKVDEIEHISMEAEASQVLGGDFADLKGGRL